MKLASLTSYKSPQLVTALETTMISFHMESLLVTRSETPSPLEVFKSYISMPQCRAKGKMPVVMAASVTDVFLDYVQRSPLYWDIGPPCTTWGSSLNSISICFIHMSSTLCQRVGLFCLEKSQHCVLCNMERGQHCLFYLLAKQFPWLFHGWSQEEESHTYKMAFILWDTRLYFCS